MSAIVDPWPRNTLEGPPTRAFEITPNDAVDVDQTRALWVGTAGHVRVRFVGDHDPVTLTNVPVGMHPMRVTRVYATGTTASGLVGLR